LKAINGYNLEYLEIANKVMTQGQVDIKADVIKLLQTKINLFKNRLLEAFSSVMINF
jgi:hypothetical protein